MALLEKLKALSEDGRPRDPASIVAEWTHGLNELYSFVGQSLFEFTKMNYGRLDFKGRRISEDELGEYDVAELHFIVGSEAIVFAPAFRYVIGADGRVDVYRRGRISDGVTLLRTGAANEEGPGWVIAHHDRPPSGDVPLTKQSLEGLIEALLP